MSTCDCEFCGVVFQPHTVFDCLRNVIFRVKELETKLGAASVTDNKAQAFGRTGPGQEAAAAPSVSAEWWRQREQTCLECGRSPDARSAALAAAVTEWLQRHELDDSRDGTSEEFLFSIVIAFVRGEPLPKKEE